MNNDLISRSELIKAFEKVYPLSTNEMGVVVNKRIYDIIDNAPTVKIDTNDIEYKAYCKGLEDGKKIARPQVKWIPISERLPDLWEVVLVTDEYGNVFEYERRPLDDDRNVCSEWRFLNRKIIAWQPEPEPYKEGGAE